MGQGVTISSNKSTIINNWVELNQASSILFNKITNEQIQRHSRLINNKSELIAYSKRMQEHFSSICRIIYFCPKSNTQSNLSIMSNETNNLRAKSSSSTNDKSKYELQQNSGQILKQYLIFTDRMIPIKEWTREKIISIIKIFKKLVTQYGFFKVKQKCLCENQRKEIKIWINQNPIQNNPIELVQAEQDMIADLAAVLVSKKQKIATQLIGVTAFDEVIQKLTRNIEKTLLEADYRKDLDMKNSHIIDKNKKGKPVQVNNYYNVFINTDNFGTGHSLQSSQYNSINTNNSYIHPKTNFKINQPSLNQTNLFVNLEKKKVEFNDKFNRAIITSSKEKVIQRIDEEEHSPSRKLKTQNLQTDQNKYKVGEYSYTKRVFQAPVGHSYQMKPKSKIDNFLTVNQEDQQKKINSSVPKFLQEKSYSKERQNSSGQIKKNIKMIGLGQKVQIFNKDFEIAQNSKNNLKNYNPPIYPFKQPIPINEFQNIKQVQMEKYGKNKNNNPIQKTQQGQIINSNRQVSAIESKKFPFGNSISKTQSRRQSDISDLSQHNSISNNSAAGSLNQKVLHTPFYVKTTNNNIKDNNSKANSHYNFNKDKNAENYVASKSKAKQSVDYYKKYQHLDHNGTHKSFIGYGQNNFKQTPSLKTQDKIKQIVEQKKEKTHGFYQPNKITSNNNKQPPITNSLQLLGDNKSTPLFLQQRKKFPSTYATKNQQKQSQNQKEIDKKLLKFEKSSLKSQNSGQIKVQNHLQKPPLLQTNYLKKSTNSYNTPQSDNKSQKLQITKGENYKNFSYFALEHKKLEHDQHDRYKIQEQNEAFDIARNLSLPYPHIPQRKQQKHFTFQQIQQPAFQKHIKTQIKIIHQHNNNNRHMPSSSYKTETKKIIYGSNTTNLSQNKFINNQQKDEGQEFVFHRTTSGDVDIGNNCSIVNNIQKRSDRGGMNQSNPGHKIQTGKKLTTPVWSDINKINTYGSLIHGKYMNNQPSKYTGKGVVSNFSTKKQTESLENFNSSQKAEYIQPELLVKKSLKKQIQMECFDLFGSQILKKKEQQQEQIESKDKQLKKDIRSSEPAPQSSQSINIKEIDYNNDEASLLNNVSSKDLLIKQKVQKKKAKYAELKSQFSDLFG